MAEAVSDGLPQPQRRLAVFAIALASTMGTLDVNIANTALPAIARDLGLDLVAEGDVDLDRERLPNRVGRLVVHLRGARSTVRSGTRVSTWRHRLYSRVGGVRALA